MLRGYNLQTQLSTLLHRQATKSNTSPALAEGGNKYLLSVMPGCGIMLLYGSLFLSVSESSHVLHTIHTYHWVVYSKTFFSTVRSV